MIIHIKNMVCPRCIMTVEDICKKLGIQIESIQLGKVVTLNDQIDIETLKSELEKVGFELIEDKKVQIVEHIKSLVIEIVHQASLHEMKINFSDYISREIGKDYTYLSNLFSEIENNTIEKYIILQKIEKVKELIDYGELNFSEIAFQLDYSSAAHLSKQFKKITGSTPSEYKKLKNINRKTLDNI